MLEFFWNASHNSELKIRNLILRGVLITTLPTTHPSTPGGGQKFEEQPNSRIRL
jgi:hypothetical protein